MKRYALFLAVVIMVVLCFPMEKRFVGMGRSEDIEFLLPDVADLHYVVALEQRDTLGLGLTYEGGEYRFLGGIRLSNFGLTVNLERSEEYGDIYGMGFGLFLHPLSLGLDITSRDTFNDLQLELGLVGKRVLLVGTVGFENLPPYEDPGFFDEIQKKIESGEFTRGIVGRLQLSELLLSGKYVEDPSTGKRGAMMVGFAVPINHVYRVKAPWYSSRTYLYRVKMVTYPTLIGIVYSFKDNTGTVQNVEERLGLIAEGLVMPCLTVRMGFWSQKSNGGEYGPLEQYMGIGLILSNMRIDMHFEAGSNLSNTKWGVEVTLDTLK